MANKTTVSSTMRCDDQIKGNTGLTPDDGLTTQYYGSSNPVSLPKPVAGTGQPPNGGLINKNMGKGGMPKGLPSDETYDKD